MFQNRKDMLNLMYENVRGPDGESELCVESHRPHWQRLFAGICLYLDIHLTRAEDGFYT